MRDVNRVDREVDGLPYVGCHSRLQHVSPTVSIRRLCMIVNDCQ